MYKTEDFLNRYREMEEWANGKYGYDCLKRVEDTFYNVNIQKEIRYFKNVRNVLSHNCNNNDDPYIVLTEAFKDRFEKLCWYLMDNVSQIYVPYNFVMHITHNLSFYHLYHLLLYMNHHLSL